MKWTGRGRARGCDFCFGGKDRYEVSGPLERGKDWGCGVVELVTHVHIHVQIVGPRGMGRFMQVFYFYIFLSSSFLPSFLLVPVELPHLVKYMSSTDLTVPAISYFL